MNYPAKVLISPLGRPSLAVAVAVFLTVWGIGALENSNSPGKGGVTSRQGRKGEERRWNSTGKVILPHLPCQLPGEEQHGPVSS